MSDIDKLFEHAPEGAVELKETAETGYLRWFNEKGQAYGAYGWFPARDHFETIATRPQPEQEKDGECYAVQMKNLIKEAKANGFEIEQVDSGVNWRKIQPERKTVEDAVEAFPNGWESIPYKQRNIDHDLVILCAKEDFVEDSARFKKGELYQGQITFCKDSFYLVCTREEFEACVAAKSEPEWTHVSESGYKCRYLMNTVHGDLYENERGTKFIPGMGVHNKVKPIKPTITKAEAWDRTQVAGLTPQEVNERFTVK